MPNRIIKDSIKTSEEIDRLSWFEEVLFYRLMVSADDYGRYDGRARVLKNTLFPTKDDVTLKMVENALDTLRETELVHAYTVKGVPILQIVKWNKHQQIRSKKSKYPSPEEADDPQMISDCEDLISNDIRCNQEISNAPVIQSNPIQSNSASSDAAERADEMFNRLWERYPRKKGKSSVSKTQRAKLLKVGEEKLNRCIDLFLRDMQGRSIEYIPYGSTFFNSAYKDYLTEDAAELKPPDNPTVDERGYEIVPDDWGKPKKKDVGQWETVT